MPATITTGSSPSDVAAPAASPINDTRNLMLTDAALADFRALGERVGRAIRFLDGLLERRAALPLDAWDEDRALATRYLVYRYGPAPTGQRSIHDLVAEGWGKAVECRIAYRRLSKAGQQAIVRRYGAFTDRQGSDNPLWVLGFPQRALDALDSKAAGMGIGRGVTR